MTVRKILAVRCFTLRKTCYTTRILGPLFSPIMIESVRIEDFVLMRANMVQEKPVFWYILSSVNSLQLPVAQQLVLVKSKNFV